MCSASLAGITALPTNPTVLLSLGPLANSLAAALPTSSVLSVLLTAAPSGFVSNIVNNPSYANSFESAFSAGSSPSWFNALPTDVKSYLHTYSGFGQVAGAAGGIQSAERAATSNGTIASGTAAATGGSITGSAASTTGSQSSGGTTGSGSSGSMATMTSSSPAAGGSSASSAPAAGGASSASSHGGAAAPTGALAAGVVGMVGILGAAAVL